MANEVVVMEYKSPPSGQGSSIGGTLVTSQILDIAEASAAMNAATNYIIVQSKGTGFWLKVGVSGVSAAAETDGNIWIPADQKSDPIPVNSLTLIDTAA